MIEESRDKAADALGVAVLGTLFTTLLAIDRTLSVVVVGGALTATQFIVATTAWLAPRTSV